MKTSEELYSEILRAPQSDELRLEFAESVRYEEPEWTKNIKRSLENWESDRSPGAVRYADVQAFTGVDGPRESIAKRLAVEYARFEGVLVYYSRGFPGWLVCTPQVLLDHGDDLLSMAPILGVTVSGYRIPRTEFDAQVRQLASCTSLSRIYTFGISAGEVTTETLVELTRSPHLEKMIRLNIETSDNQPEQVERAWEALLASPACRRMMNWNRFTRTGEGWDWRVSITAPREFGDIQCEAVNGGMGITTSYEPMNAESRALEQRYGYIPALHAANWSAGVLDVLQGRKPVFPAGARPTEAMYAVPAVYEERGPGA